MDHVHGTFFAYAKSNGKYHGQPLQIEYRTAQNGDVTRAPPAPAPGGGANAAAGGAAGDGNDADGAAEGDDDGEGEGDGDEPPPAIPFPSPSLQLTCMTSAVVAVFPLVPADSAPYGCDTHLDLHQPLLRRPRRRRRRRRRRRLLDSGHNPGADGGHGGDSRSGAYGTLVDHHLRPQGTVLRRLMILIRDWIGAAGELLAFATCTSSRSSRAIE